MSGLDVNGSYVAVSVATYASDVVRSLQCVLSVRIIAASAAAAAAACMNASCQTFNSIFTL